jgi:hypothetical protein
MGRGLSNLQRTILEIVSDRPMFLHQIYFQAKKKYFAFETTTEGGFRFKPNPNDRRVTVSICRAIARLKRRGLIIVEDRKVRRAKRNG